MWVCVPRPANKRFGCSCFHKPERPDDQKRGALLGDLHAFNSRSGVDDSDVAMMKMTNIEMDWTDNGASVFFQSTLAIELNCPCCGARVAPNVEHLCGDR